MKNLLLILLVLTANQAFSQCDSFIINFNVADTAQDTLICTPSSVAFKDLSSHNYKDQSVDFKWSFEDLRDKSVLQNPAHTYMDAGTFDVTFYAETANGCKDSITKKGFITVIGPHIDFKLINDSVCNGDSLFVEVNVTSVGPATTIIKLGNGTVVNATTKRKRIGLLADTKTGGKKELTALVSVKVQDPNTGIVKDCKDRYPYYDANEDSILAHVYGPLEELDVKGWPSSGLYLSNKGSFSWHYWIFDGDTQRVDTFKTTVNGDLSLVASNDTCQISRSWKSVGIKGHVAPSFDMRYSSTNARLTLSNSDEAQFQVSIFNTNGQLVASKSAANGVVLFDLANLQSGVYMIKAQAGRQFWNASFMR